MSQRKYHFSVILNNLNKPSDRFLTSGYGAPGDNAGVYELIERAAGLGLLEGVEMLMDPGSAGGTWIGIGPNNYRDVKKVLDDNGLALCGIIPNLWGSYRIAGGTLGNRDGRLRRECIDLCKQAVDIAAAADCPYVGLWPGHDGFDYYFETDYQQLWAWWVEGMQEIADHNPNIRLGLEPKPNEPRGYSFISTVPKALLLMEDIGRANVGLNLDIGHSLYGMENLADVIALAQQRGSRLFHMHINDNYRAADLDMIFGTVHTLEFIEMFYWLRRTGYDKYMSIDLFAYRTDPTRSVEEGVKWMRAYDMLIDQVGMDALGNLITAGDPIQASAFLREVLLGG